MSVCLLLCGVRLVVVGAGARCYMGDRGTPPASTRGLCRCSKALRMCDIDYRVRGPPF